MSGTIAQVLDLLMIVVLLMFIPIGLWRGVLREWVALGGIALGTLLSAEWAGPWGGDLAARTGGDAQMGAFVVGAGFFLGTTLLVGYGGGAALPFRPELTRTNRLLGALLGVGNGTLILSGVLRLMQQHLFAGQPESLLLGTTLSRFLIDDIGWAQLLLLIVLLLCVVVSVLRRWAGGLPLMEEFAPSYALTSRPRGEQSDEVWEAYPPDEEPAPMSAGMAAFAGPSVQQHDTAILQIVPNQGGSARQEPPRPRQAPVPLSPPRTTLVSVPKVIDLARPARATPPPPAGREGAAGEGDTGGAGAVESAPLLRANGAAEAGAISMSLRAEPTANGGASGAGTTPPAPLDFGAAGIACPVCGNLAAARSRFCHHCGHIIGEAERRRVARQD